MSDIAQGSNGSTPSVAAIDTISEAVNAQLAELNAYKPPELRPITDDHPVIQFALAAAASIRETALAAIKDAEAHLAEAKQLEEECSRVADALIERAKETATETRHRLSKMRELGKGHQSLREQFLSNA